jgi:hypothetical protein
LWCFFIFPFFHFDRTKVTKPPKKGKAKAVKKPDKKKWDTVAAGQYIRGGKHVAVGWGKYGEAEHGEEVSVLFAIVETNGIIALTQDCFLFFIPVVGRRRGRRRKFGRRS